jgi:hypothetical protein
VLPVLREEFGIDPAKAVLFAVTPRSEPSFLLNLMDTWFSDVYTLPMNVQVVVARISRVLSVHPYPRFLDLCHQRSLPPSAAPVNRISTRSVAPHTGFLSSPSFRGQWISGSPSRKSHFR